MVYLLAASTARYATSAHRVYYANGRSPISTALTSPYSLALSKLDLRILDDWMRDPISTAEMRDLLEILDDDLGRVSTLVASQGLEPDWFSRFPGPHSGGCDSQLHGSQLLSPETTGRIPEKIEGNLDCAEHMMYNELNRRNFSL